MATSLAFLPLSPLPTRRSSLLNAHNPKLVTCSARPPDPSRRKFFSRILEGVTTLIVASSAPFRRIVAAESDTSVQVTSEQLPAPAPPPPKPKPKRVTWGYAADNGPSKWGSLSQEWALCSTGHSQSPIALSYREALPCGDTPRPTLSTFPSKFSVRLKEVAPNALNRSVVIEQYIPPPPPIVGDAPPFDTYTPPPPPALIVLPNVATYFLRMIHFHADSSEHMVNGKRGNIEAHFVFGKRARAPTPPPPPKESDKPPEQPIRSPDSVQKLSLEGPNEENGIVGAAQAEGSSAPHTLVVAMLGFTGNECDSWMEEVLSGLPSSSSEETRSTMSLVDIDLAKVLPDFQSADFYTYSGSLTTPPGTEGVHWIVLGQRMCVTDKEVSKLVQMQGGTNVRPLQPLNDRKVMRFPSRET